MTTAQKITTCIGQLSRVNGAGSFGRSWAMPSNETFSVMPILEFAQRHLVGRVVDPFARNSTVGTVTNDLNPATSAMYHMDAVEFLDLMIGKNERFDSAIFDPPYSPRQISEVYQQIGKKCFTTDTQNGRLYAAIRARLIRLVVPGGVVCSFGWNSTGMGKHWTRMETLLVCHGGGHNDTICVADKNNSPFLF